MRTKQHLPGQKVWTVIGLCALAFLFSLPSWATNNVVFLVGLAVAEALFALSWNLMFGYGGLVNFGAAGFFAIGAYFSGAALRYAWPLPFLITLLLAAVLGGLVAIIVGAVVLRRMTGIHLAVVTLALAEVLSIFISHSEKLGRDDGLSAIPRPRIDIGFAQLDLTSNASYYFFMVFSCVCIALALWALVTSNFGRVLRAIRLDPTRAAFVGINVARYRLIAFGISGAVGASAGALTSPLTQIASLDVASWLHSAQPMLNTLLGGAGYFWGPVIGAFVYAGIGYFTRTLTGVSEMVVGLILLVIVLAAPQGISGIAIQLAHKFGRHRYSKKLSVEQPSKREVVE